MFQCSSASRKFLNANDPDRPTVVDHVSVLFSEPKIPQFPLSPRRRCSLRVSVLFSEPKIPQLKAVETGDVEGLRFSALQRAENSSIVAAKRRPVAARDRFSALQRAENSSTHIRVEEPQERLEFQCSSASRKFLNLDAADFAVPQRRKVSVLFSEPKIPQCPRIPDDRYWYYAFQCSSASRKFLNASKKRRSEITGICFSALQRAENSSIALDAPQAAQRRAFQCSSASRKFLNGADR